MKRMIVALGVALGGALGVALGVALVAACTPAPRPVERPRVVESLCPAPPARPVEIIERIVAELGRVDEELERIDDALIAAADVGATTLAEARLLVERKRAAPRDSDIRLRDDDPFLVRRAAGEVLLAREQVVELQKVLGPRHVDLVRARQRLTLREKQYTEQRDAELAFATSWGELLKKLPATASARDLRTSRVRALAGMKDTIDRGFVPSEAPAALVAAALRIGDLQSRRDELALDVGPKHPELMAVTERLRDARAHLDKAFLEAQRLADTATPPVVDPEMVARRAALAKEAQLLRRELATQLAR